eukprot:2692991-Prymnesium_polylepis.1
MILSSPSASLTSATIGAHGSAGPSACWACSSASSSRGGERTRVARARPPVVTPMPRPPSHE